MKWVMRMFKNDFVSRLLSIAQYDEKSDPVFVRISQTMLAHLNELGQMKNQQLASMCYVDASTISRFVQSLGFYNYAEFRDYFSEYQELYGMDHYFDWTKINPTEQTEILVDTACQSLRQSFQMLDMQQLDQVVECLDKHREILLCGDRYSQLVAQDFQLKLLSLGCYAKTYKDIGLQLDYLHHHQGLMIMFSASLRYSDMFFQNDWQSVLITRNAQGLNLADICLLYDDQHGSDWTVHSVNDRFCMEMIVDQIIYRLAYKRKLQKMQEASFSQKT